MYGDTLYDFKFSNNIDNYLKSPQLSIYKHYLEQVRPDIKINHLKYVFVPKIQIRQKFKATPPETISEFRNIQKPSPAGKVDATKEQTDEESIIWLHEI